MKLTELTNICSISDRAACTSKVKAFIRNHSFLQMLMWGMDCSQRIKDYYLTHLVLSEGRTNSREL